MSFAAGRKESLLPDQKGTGKFTRSLQKNPVCLFMQTGL
jgi:multidrug resistance efflux pump